MLVALGARVTQVVFCHQMCKNTYFSCLTTSCFHFFPEPVVSCPRADAQGSHDTLGNPTYIRDSIQSKEEADLFSKYHVNIKHWFQICPVASKNSKFTIHTFHGALRIKCYGALASKPYMDAI